MNRHKPESNGCIRASLDFKGKKLVLGNKKCQKENCVVFNYDGIEFWFVRKPKDKDIFIA